MIDNKHKNLIKNGLNKPKNLWIVVSNNINYETNFNKFLNLLFWEHANVFCLSEKYITLKYNDNYKEREFVINKIIYKIIDSEINIINNTIDNLYLLEKIFFSNIDILHTSTIYNESECPICKCESENKTIMNCGHVFCGSCLLEYLKIKNACPICRKVSKLRGIDLNINEIGKYQYIKKLILKLCINTLENILIRVDNMIYGRGLLSLLNKFINDNNLLFTVYILSDNNKNDTRCIYIYIDDKQNLCQNIKNVKNIIILTNLCDNVFISKSLGYDYCYKNENVNIWIFEPNIIY